MKPAFGMQAPSAAMTYFELFEIPVQLKVDVSALKRKFIELSRQYHPDYFANGSAAIQAEALEKSALLNKAWKTFQDSGDTIKYVLQSKNLLEEEEKYELPPDFLMEVLEINEQLMDREDSRSVDSQSVDSQAVDSQAVDSQSVDSLESAVNNLEKEIYEPVKKIVEHYEEGVTSEEELLRVKEYYYKKKYLDRISRQLAGMQ